MNVIDKLRSWVEGYAVGIPRCYCENCEKTITGEDERCPTCGSDLTEVEVVPEYGFGPMY